MTTSAPAHLDHMDPGWENALAPVAGQIRAIQDVLAQGASEGKQFLPPQDDVLRAFTYPFDQVKVLIVGQDPYPTPGHSMGLAFSVTPGTRVPASLRNIFTELVADTGCETPSNGDLRKWAEQGVCLLNQVMTVEAGKPGSHRGIGWEHVTQVAVKALADRERPLVAILWGRGARELKPYLGATPTIESAHPSPLAAYRGFFGSRPFSSANALLEAQGASPIDWSLAGCPAT